MNIIKHFPVYFIVLIPIFSNIIGGSGAAQFLINSLILFSIFLYLGFYKINFLEEIHIIFVLYMVAFIIIFLSSVLYDAPLIRTLSDSGRLLLFGVFVHFGFLYQKHFKCKHEEIAQTIIYLGVISVIFSSLVFFEFSYPFIDLFKGRQSTEEYLFHFYRFSGFHGYPTDFSVFLNFCILLVYFQFERGVYSLKKTMIFFVIFLLGIILSFARGGMLQFALLVMFIFFLSPAINLLRAKQLNRRIRFVYGSSILILILVVFLGGFLNFILLNENQYLVYLSSIFSSDIDSSITHRFNELSLVEDVIWEDRLIPLGDERLEPYGMDTIEGLYSHYALRYGLAGLILILILYIFKLTYLFSYKENNSLSFALFWWFLTFIIILAPFSDVTTRLKGLSFYSFLLGIALSSSKSNNKTI